MVNSVNARTLRHPTWYRFAALLTAFAFAVLISISVTHHHDSDAEDRDCAVCTAVAHQMSDSGPSVAAPVALYVLLYVMPTVVVRSASFELPPLFPPACGPPDEA